MSRIKENKFNYDKIKIVSDNLRKHLPSEYKLLSEDINHRSLKQIFHILNSATAKDNLNEPSILTLKRAKGQIEKYKKTLDQEIKEYEKLLQYQKSIRDQLTLRRSELKKLIYGEKKN